MSGNKALLDTNVIIFASKRQIDIPQLLSSYDFFYTSIISFMFEVRSVIIFKNTVANKGSADSSATARRRRVADVSLLATIFYL
jgi:rRNA-processing protein FCF1